MPSERPVPVPTVPPEPTRPAPLEEENEEVSHTWGHVFREAAGGIVGMLGGGSAIPDYSGMGFGMPGVAGGEIGPPTPAAAMPVAGMPEGSCDGMIWSGGVPPKGYKVVNSCGVGVLRKVRRRRRRRLLTASDKADISYIVATTGKGQLAASLIHRSAQ